MNPQTTVSIIVPVYNASATLRSLVDSVISQCYKHWELILVDDGSKDDSLSICQAFAAQDKRLRVIHQENAGVSAARNAGLKAAQGEWVTFVDSDDIVLDCFLRSLVDAVSADNQIDLAYCGYAIVDASTSVMTYHSATYIGKDQIHDVLSKTNLLYRCSPWAKLFRRSIIVDNGLRFDENLSISEDRLFLYNYLVYVRGIAVTSQVGYIYGSFSPMSLKHKRVPTEMLAYRQKAITEAAHEVINQFGLGKGEAYLIARHLVLILFELIRNVYYDYGVSKRTVLQQQELFYELFEVELYRQNLKYNKSWQDQMAANLMIRNMLEQKFPKLNYALFRTDFDLKLRFMAYNLIKGDNTSCHSFERIVSILNKDKE